MQMTHVFQTDQAILVIYNGCNGFDLSRGSVLMHAQWRNTVYVPMYEYIHHGQPLIYKYELFIFALSFIFVDR